MLLGNFASRSVTGLYLRNFLPKADLSVVSSMSAE